MAASTSIDHLAGIAGGSKTSPSAAGPTATNVDGVGNQSPLSWSEQVIY